MEESQELWGFLRQSHISEKNLARLATLADSPDEVIARDAKLVLEIGKAHPYKRKRVRFLLKERHDLLQQLLASGFDPVKQSDWHLLSAAESLLEPKCEIDPEDYLLDDADYARGSEIEFYDDLTSEPPEWTSEDDEDDPLPF